MEPLLDVQNLSVSFPTANGETTVLHNASYRIDRGEVLAIVGESGSGKSVAMLAVMGLLPTTATVKADRIAFEGRDISNLSATDRRRIIGKDIAMIFQEPVASLNPCFTAGFQIEEVLKQHTDLDKKARHARAIELLEAVGLPNPEDRLIRTRCRAASASAS